MKCSQRGFTLIELMVVISIIGLLASIVLAALNGARAKGRDARIIEDVGQLKILLQEEYNDNGNYLNLSKGWSSLGAGGGAYWNSSPCNNNPTSSGIPGIFQGNYAAQVIALCTDIVNNTTNVPFGWPDNGDLRLFVGPPADEGDGKGLKYSIQAYLSGSGTLICAASNGQESLTDTGGATSPGCSNNSNI